MRIHHLITAGAVALAATAMSATAPARAAQVAVDGYFYDLPTDATKNLDAVRVLIQTSDGLGMTRRCRAVSNTINSLGCSTQSFEYLGSGTIDGKKAERVSIHFDLRIPAVRTDVTFADKSRSVTVAAKDLSWDEKTPGIFDKAGATSAADRLLPLYLLPTAVVVLGQASAGQIKLSREANGNNVLIIPVPQYKTELKAVIDANGRPEHTEMTVGGKLYTGDYSDFTNDRMDYHVFGPHHIVQKVDGKVMTDLELEYHWTGPYMVFSTPKALAQK
jgi:hypothetical protein